MLSPRIGVLLCIPTVLILIFFLSGNFSAAPSSSTLEWLSSSSSYRSSSPGTSSSIRIQEAKEAAKSCDKHHSILYKDVERTEKYWSQVGGMSLDDLHLTRDICARDGNCPILKLYNSALYIRFPLENPLSFQSRAHAMLMLLSRVDFTLTPNADFVLNTQDGVRVNEPCFLEMDKHINEAASTSRSTLNHFILPDFTTYDWFEVRFPAFQTALTSLSSMAPSFSEKTPKLFWRGSTSLQQGTQRTDLVTQLEPLTSIADVKSTERNDSSRVVQQPDYKTLPEMCGYRYIIYTEGITYSGRLKYTALCNSVQIGHPITFIEFWSHLLDPYYVKVSSWDDAVTKMQALELDLPRAEKLASGLVETLREQLTAKGIDCYVQRMVEGYAKSQRWDVLSPEEDVRGKNKAGEEADDFYWVPLEHFLTRALWTGNPNMEGHDVTW